MAELTIAVRRLPGSDGLGVRVSLESDDDALPHEHEAEHRRLVARLFPGLVVADEPEARVRVRGERPARDPVVG
ncbi:MAG TPA: hypothetical protein VM597_04020 [Gemmataceae bacterium]|nr:hypothetical protein [Gemmataceae bacterium]